MEQEVSRLQHELTSARRNTHACSDSQKSGGVTIESSASAAQLLDKCVRSTRRLRSESSTIIAFEEIRWPSPSNGVTIPSYQQLLGSVSHLLSPPEPVCAAARSAPADVIQARLAGLRYCSLLIGRPVSCRGAPRRPAVEVLVVLPTTPLRHYAFAPRRHLSRHPSAGNFGGNFRMGIHKRLSLLTFTYEFRFLSRAPSKVAEPLHLSRRPLKSGVYSPRRTQGTALSSHGAPRPWFASGKARASPTDCVSVSARAKPM